MSDVSDIVGTVGPGQDPEDARAAAKGGVTRLYEKLLLAVVLTIVAGALGYSIFRVAAGPGEPDLPPGDIATVSKGEPVDLETAAVPGKYTIYDFYADWCPPCRVLDVELHHLAARHENVALRKIDIIDWTSEVVAQHGVVELPHLILYGPDGRRIAEGDEVFLRLAELFPGDF